MVGVWLKRHKGHTHRSELPQPVVYTVFEQFSDDSATILKQSTAVGGRSSSGKNQSCGVEDAGSVLELYVSIQQNDRSELEADEHIAPTSYAAGAIGVDNAVNPDVSFVVQLGSGFHSPVALQDSNWGLLS